MGSLSQRVRLTQSFRAVLRLGRVHFEARIFGGIDFCRLGFL